MHAGPFRCRVRDGRLEPFEASVWQAVLKEFGDRVVYVELEDEKRMRTRQQEKLWHGVCVPTLCAFWTERALWKLPASGKASHDACHDAWMRIVFGEVQTPVGRARRSSTGLTIEEYGQLIDAASEYLRGQKPPILLPNEGANL